MSTPPSLPNTPSPQAPAAKPKKKKLSFGVKFLLVLITILVVKVGYHMVFPARSTGSSSTASYSEPGRNEFDNANRMIISDQHGVANGNSPEAVAIAKQFSESMLMMRSVLFTGGDDKAFSLTDGQFITYCAVNGDRCAIIVHVPQLRKFKADAKESMNDLAWICAWRSAVESGLDIKKLGVGVKGAIQYSAVMTGPVDSASEEVSDPTQRGKGIGDTKMLYKFFAHVRRQPEPKPSTSPDAESTATPAEETSAAETVASEQ